nr:DUF2871 family protein [Streptomyces sp. BK340]
MMTLHGTPTVLGRSGSDAVAGIAGLGHALLTAGLVLFFVMVGKCLPGASRAEDAVVTRPVDAAPSASPGCPTHR